MLKQHHIYNSGIVKGKWLQGAFAKVYGQLILMNESSPSCSFPRVMKACWLVGCLTSFSLVGLSMRDKSISLLSLHKFLLVVGSAGGSSAS
jgi:hypothetical protein